MKNVNRSSLAWQVAGFGVIAGMRSSSPMALLSRHFSRHPAPALQRSGWRRLCSKPAAGIFSLIALGELAVDKMPSTPDRIVLPGLVGRATAGAVAGAMLNKASEGKLPAAPLIAAAVALASTFASFYLRRELAKKIPDKSVALIEDAIVYGVGASLL